MALLHYLSEHGEEYGITLSALNCDHGIRGEASERDSAFVAAYCGGNCIKLYSFKAEKGVFKSENAARVWRQECYRTVLSGGGADFIATAHHLNDNAETVLFNLARGSALSGMTGICDVPELGLIRPLIGCSREEIDGYIKEYNIPFVTDESNFSDDYTRNKIRHNVLPELEEAVNGAAENIFRFSRIAAEDEEYFARQVEAVLVCRGVYGYLIKPCAERVIFRRAAAKIVAQFYCRKDYTAEHFNKLYNLQFLENGKKFEFLGLIAYKEEGGVAVIENARKLPTEGVPFQGGQTLETADKDESKNKILRYDADKIPGNAVIRYKREGDKFTKFGGGTKSLSDYLTDKKVPQSMRGILPLVCDKSEVLIVGGVEISDKIRIDEGTKKQGIFVCADPFKMC